MKKIHLVCNAHIDPIWQWDWQEGVSATLSTFRSAVKLADKYDYIFCHNEVTVYKYVEEYAPDTFKQICELIRKGKWHVTGGWYLQPDCNMPSGESFTRQILTGKRYFKEKFGVEPTTAFNVDPFGHSRGLVQIIKKCGQDSLVIMRPYPFELDLAEDTFLWEGFDGSTIKVFRTPEGYNTPLGRGAEEIAARIKNRKDGAGCVLWGVGNHGGGPSDKDLADLGTLIKECKDAEIVHSTPENYFKEVQPTLRVDKSLRISMPGCYTSMIEVKRRHIRLENELYLAELMCALAACKGLMDYPEEQIESCLEDLMNGEFHDVLPGSCIKAGEDNGLQLFDHGYLDATRLKTKAYFALLSRQPAAKDGEFPIIVFNPHPYRYKGCVECEFMLADQNWDETAVACVTVKDGDEIIVSQQIKEDSNINLDWRKKVIFEADLPPMDIKRYSVYLTFKPKEARPAPSLVFENARRRVEIDGRTGLLKSYVVDGRQYIKDGFKLFAFKDNPDPWGMSPAQRKRLGEDPEPFVLSQSPHGIFKNMQSVQIIEDGDVCTTVEAFFEHGDSKARIEYRIYKNHDAVDVNVNLFFRDADEIIKLAVPVPRSTRAIGQSAFGTEELFTDARENVTGRFTAVESGGKYLAVLDRSRYGCHFEDGTLYMSLVRGTTYCAHPIADRQLIPSDRFTQKTDMAQHDYSFRILVAQEHELERAALEFNRTPYAVNVFPSGGNESNIPFAFEISDIDVTLVAFKRAHGGGSYIIRLLNNSPSSRKTTLTVGGASANFTFGKYEVKTIIFDGRKLTEADGLKI